MLDSNWIKVQFVGEEAIDDDENITVANSIRLTLTLGRLAASRISQCKGTNVIFNGYYKMNDFLVDYSLKM